MIAKELGRARRGSPLATSTIPYSATARGRAVQIARDGGIHEHSYKPYGGYVAWRVVVWKLHTKICDTPRCFRLRLKHLREDVE